MKKYSTLLFFFVNHRTIYPSNGIKIFIYLSIFVTSSLPVEEGWKISRFFPANKTRDLSRHVEEKVIIAIALASLHLKKDHVIGRDTPR